MKLPNPAGPLSKVVPSEAANKEVVSCMKLTTEEVQSAPVSATSRGTYKRFTAEEKAQIAKRAAGSLQQLNCFLTVASNISL